MIYILLGGIIALLLVILRVLYVIQINNTSERRNILSDIRDVYVRIDLLQHIVENRTNKIRESTNDYYVYLHDIYKILTKDNNIIKNEAKNSCNTIKWKHKSFKKQNAKLKLNIAKNNDALAHPKE